MINEEKYKTAEERVKAFESQHCKRYSDCAQCQYNSSCGGIDGRYIGLYIMAHWLALEAEKEKPEPCPFCGGEMIGRFNSFGPSIWSGQCACGYKTKDFLTKVEVIAAHNRVCRAVRAYKESEVNVLKANARELEYRHKDADAALAYANYILRGDAGKEAK